MCIRYSHLFLLDPFGTVTEEEYIVTGSGSLLAASVIDQYYRRGLPVKEGREVAVKALLSALSRDAATGDGIDLVVVDSGGVRFVEGEELDELVKKVLKEEGK